MKYQKALGDPATKSGDTTKGKNYFVWQEVKMGTWTANSMLHSMSEEDGKRCVESSHMLKIDNQR